MFKFSISACCTLFLAVLGLIISYHSMIDTYRLWLLMPWMDFNALSVGGLLLKHETDKNFLCTFGFPLFFSLKGLSGFSSCSIQFILIAKNVSLIASLIV